MKTKTIRIEQKESDSEKIDEITNKEISVLEEKGHKIRDIRIAVGRDADVNSAIDKRYSITLILVYE